MTLAYLKAYFKINMQFTVKLSPISCTSSNLELNFPLRRTEHDMEGILYYFMSYHKLFKN